VRLVALICAAVFPAGAVAAVTYSFDWYCSGCAKLGMASNGREGPYGSGTACDGSRASLGASLASRGCGAGRCFNPQPCVATGQPDLPPPPAAIASPARIAPEPAKVRPIYDPRAERVRRADEVKPLAEAPEQAISGRWRNSFSWYQVITSKDAIEIDLVETCRTPDCVRKEYPNRPVFLGKLEGNRLVGVVPIRNAIESEQNGRHCGTPAGEFPVEGRLSEDRNAIVWGNARLPVVEGCAPAAISLGTWRRG
jgi:hypothetical protein